MPRAYKEKGANKVQIINEEMMHQKLKIKSQGAYKTWIEGNTAFKKDFCSTNGRKVPRAYENLNPALAKYHHGKPKE